MPKHSHNDLSMAIYASPGVEPKDLKKVDIPVFIWFLA